uniref:Uncharacterized protein n=1 Tax=Arundo donax TaxID=35708 RepID=A0A0A9AD94_ARUDO
MIMNDMIASVSCTALNFLFYKTPVELVKSALSDVSKKVPNIEPSAPCVVIIAVTWIANDLQMQLVNLL